MTEEFDRSGVALLTANPTTVYQVPGDTAGATSLVLSCLAAHVADSNATASIELRIVSPAGQVLGTPVRRALIGPGMAVELVPNRHVLGPGERVQAIASSGGLLSILISVLGPELSPNRRGIANVEAYARFIPPETVGSNKNIVNVGSVVEADVTFRAPAIRIGVVVRPPALAVTAGPVVPALAFGAVTIEAPSRSIALSAGVPFVGSAVEAVAVPKAELTLTAAAPVVATGSGVVVPAAQITLSAPVPSVVTTAALDSDAAAYIAAVEAADGQSLEVDVKTAINNFIVGCKADGIWTALKASCILSGARTLSGALVPLVGTAPTNNNFVSGDYNRETGLVGNGSTKYLDSNRNNNADPQNSKHISAYVTTAPTTGGVTDSNGYPVCIGAGTGATGSSEIFRDNNATTGSTRSNCATASTFTGAGTATGLLATSRSSSSSYVARFISSNQTITQTSQTPFNGTIGVFKAGSGSAANATYHNGRLAFYSIGESLDLALLDARVGRLVAETTFAINTGLDGSTYDIDTLKYINAGYAAGGSLS